MINHLWQSTLFAAVAGLLTLALRSNHARARHWLWLAASCKFLLPFSLLVAAGSHLGWTTPPAARPHVVVVTEAVVFQSPAFSAAVPASPNRVPIVPVTWGCGF